MEVRTFKLEVVIFNYYNYSASISLRHEKGRVNVEKQGLICAEEGLVCSPLHSRGYLIYSEEDWQEPSLKVGQKLHFDQD